MDFKLTVDDREHARKVLLVAKEMLPDRWCSGANALTCLGFETTPGAADATQFCVVGALRRGAQETGSDVLPALRLLHYAVCMQYPWMRDVPAWDAETRAATLREWNDGTAKDLDEVLRTFDHALLALE